MATPIKNSTELKAFLFAKGWMSADEQPAVEPLGGGVSNEVWKVEGTGFRWVVKQALGQLRVEAVWHSDPARIRRERDAMEAASRILPPGAVPGVVHYDDDAHLLVMECAPAGSANWKEELLKGRWDPRIAREAGRILGCLHSRSTGMRTAQRAPFADLQYFRQLRLDPFHAHVAAQYPQLRACIDALAAELVRNGEYLVHGDYSPKNLLIAPDGQLKVLDFEVAHWGNPVFDAAFCVTHLILKGFALQDMRMSSHCIERFLDGYGRNVRRLLPHTGVLLLARIDGKSPVGYLRPELRDPVRQLAATWILQAGAADQSFRQDTSELLSKLEQYE